MNNPIDIILQLGIFAKIIIVLLIILSLVSWTIIFDKLLKNRVIRKESRNFFHLFSNFRSYKDVAMLSQEFRHSPYPRIVRTVQKQIEQSKAKIDMKHHFLSKNDSDKTEVVVQSLPQINSFLEDAIMNEISKMEQHLIFLSTTVSISPFLGLLGTVWGIMSAFISMGAKGSADIATIGPGIAEALITTIVGLAVAIPALIAYNFFIDKIRQEENRMTMFARELMQIFEGENN